jgi:micrococcal nuclease
VVHVTDGDTIVVLTDDKEQIRIRLYGIDAPESRQPFGSKATRFVRDIAALEIVEIDERYLDRYGRTIATVFLPDGTNLNEELVRVGLAWVYTRYCDEQPMCSRWDALQQESSVLTANRWYRPQL